MAVTKDRLPNQWLSYLWAATVTSLSIFLPMGASLPLRLEWLLVFLVVVFTRSWALFPASLLFFLIYSASDFLPPWFWLLPPLPILMALALVFLVCVLFPRLKRELDWITPGTLDFSSRLLVMVTSLLAAAALIAWAAWTDNLGAGAEMVHELKGIPPWFLLLVGVPAFALLNAIAEEMIYRGFLQSSLEKAFPDKARWVILLQASAFAAAHFAAGFPNGKVGYGMALVYACMLGYLRWRTGGMLAPLLAHIAADLVIGYTLVLLAGQ